MQFKKGDIVEVTEEDRWYGETYDIGTRWVVIDTTHRFVFVKDDRQHDGEGSIFKYKIKLIKEANKMLKLEEGQIYICTKSHVPWWTEGKEYRVQTLSNGDLYITDDDGQKYTEYYINTLETKFILKYEPPMEEPPMEKEQENRTTDLIDNQPHYKNQGIEPIDLMRANMTKEQFYGFLLGNSQKYLSRHEQKNKVEDLKKCITYISWMIEEWENGNKN